MIAQDLFIGARLRDRLVEFGHLLYESGLPISTQQVMEAAQSLAYVNITDPEEFAATLKACLLTRHEHEELYLELYHYFWLVRHRLSDEQESEQAASPEAQPFRLPPSERQKLAEHMQAQSSPSTTPEMLRPTEQPVPQEERLEAPGETPEESLGVAFSAVEYLKQKEFDRFSWEELQEAKLLLAAMRWQIAPRRTRRTIAAPHGQRLDLRRLLRQAGRLGGELPALRWRTQKEKPRPLVVICDISGSMALYSRMLLHFLHTLAHGAQRVEAFVFGTRLTRITKQLQRRDVDTAVEEVTKLVEDWSGGTRIGQALQHFRMHWSRRVMGQGPLVLLISDGWDRGDPEMLAEEMNRLQHRSHSMIWLNPLLGNRSYRPLTSGMKAALPYIDDFRSIHNLDSIVQLGHVLEGIGSQRPSRSPMARRAAQQRWLNRHITRSRAFHG